MNLGLNDFAVSAQANRREVCGILLSY